MAGSRLCSRRSRSATSPAGWIFARYLLRMNRSGPGRHGGEIWGALASTDYKNFLRMKIDADERLTIYPIGIRRSVAWHFDPEGADEDPWFAPDWASRRAER